MSENERNRESPEMDIEAARDALRGIENSARLLSLALTGNTRRPALYRWGTDVHVDAAIARLGVFEVAHLELELQMGKNAVAKRIREAIDRGVAVQVSPAVQYNAAVYRWTGKSSSV